MLDRQWSGFPRVIVFGGAGFIGSHLLQWLADKYPESQLYSLDVAEPRFQTAGATYLHHDLRDPIPPALCGGGPALIVNLAAVHATPGHKDWEYYWTNVLAATNVCRFASAIRASEIVLSSSISVYGPSEEPMDEDSSLNPVTAYGRSKLMAEKIHGQWQHEDSAARSLTIVRPAVIYGLYERGNFTRLAGALARGRFVYPARKNTIKSCGYVKDLIASLMHMRNLTNGTLTYNFCYPQRTTTEDVCTAFCKVKGYGIPKLVVPRSLIMAAGLGFETLAAAGLKTGINRERLRKLVVSTNIVPKRLQEAQFNFSFDLLTSLMDWHAASPSGGFD
jgi:nucleoside-diphosphate-sugar epimerase